VRSGHHVLSRFLQLKKELLMKVQTQEWDFPGAQEGGLTMFLQTCVRSELEEKRFCEVSKQVLEYNFKLQNAFQAMVSFKAAGWKITGSLMVMAMCAIQKDVDSREKNEIVSLQEMLTMFNEDITYAEEGFEPTWDQTLGDAYEQAFLACMLAYALKRFLLSQPAASKNISQLNWRGAKFDEQLLKTIAFLDTIKIPEDLKTSEAETFIELSTVLAKGMKSAAATNMWLTVIQAISQCQTLNGPDIASFLKIKCQDTTKTAAFKAVVGVLTGIFATLSSKLVVATELDQQLLVTCALLHNEVLICIFFFCFLLSFDEQCVPFPGILYYILIA
jgi:hypothetical protein